MKNLTIVVSCVNAVGHMNACAGSLSKLSSRRHRIIFVIEKAFEGKLSSLGYEEFVWSKQSAPEVTQSANGKIKENPGEQMAQLFLANKVIGPFTPLEKMDNVIKLIVDPSPVAREEFKLFDAAVQQAIREYHPDLIYADGALLPAVYHSGIPWIKQISTAPLFFEDDPLLPPGGSGLPCDDSTEWHLFDTIRRQFSQSSKYGDMVQGFGYERFPNDETFPDCRQLLTVYAYPEELNYDAIRSKGWFNMEVFNKSRPENRVALSQLISGDFLNDDLNGKFSGKLIYVSMGTMGSVDLDLMNRLLGALSKTNHKYIVSKGPRHDEFELPPNAWGDRYLAQTKIVPHMDLVITHGGNNTVTETFSEGKPMIVIPLFADQYDNAQRFKETGLGARIDPYNFTEAQLVETIDRLFGDVELAQKLQFASKRIHETDRHEELAIKIERSIVG